MATEKLYTGNGSTTNYSFEFPYLEETDIKVSLDGVDTTAYSLANATTIAFSSAPANGAAIRIYRITDAGNPKATFFAGSAIRAQDLNDNFNQVLYNTQETVDRRVNKTGDTMTGDLGFAAGVNVVFEGSTDNAFEATLTGGDPTADRILDLPDSTGTLVSTGDTGTVATAMIADSNITTAKIADSNVTTAKIADSNVTTAKIADDNVTTAKLDDLGVTTAKIADLNVTTGKIADANVTTAKIADDNVTTAKIADLNVTTGKLADSAVTNAKILDGTITLDKLTDGTVVTNSEVSGATVNDTSVFTTSASDLRYFRQDSSETITSGVTWSGGDTFVATTAAIDARIVDLVEEVGGFVPIADETSFPAANPDVNNGTGTIVSVAEIVTSRTPTNGIVTIANAAGTETVTIEGCGTTVLADGYGMLVETTATLHTYTFHRLVPVATEVTTVANNAAAINTAATNVADINNFADVYQIDNTDPTEREDTTALQAGDLVYRTDRSVIRAFNGTEYQDITPDAATLADIQIVSNDLATFTDLGAIDDAVTANQSGGALETCADNIGSIRTLARIEDGTDATDAIQNVNAIRANVTTVAGVAANVTTCANNIANINTFANTYTVSSTAPSNPDSGDLWYDSSSGQNTLKFYDGTTWNAISAGIASMADDTTPELSGALDCNNNNLSEVGTISGNNLQIDFGSI